MGRATMFHLSLRQLMPLALTCLLMLLTSAASSQEGRWGAVIERVEDGNTLITSQGEKLRLIDVRLPDAQAQRDSLVNYLKETLEGKDVLLEKDFKERDEDEALFVYVFLEKVLVNAEALARGLGTMQRRTANTRYQEFFFRSQAAAYTAGYGLWGGRAVTGVSKVGGPVSAQVQPKISTLSRPSPYARVKKEVLITPETMNNEGVDKAEMGDLEGAMATWKEASQLMPRLYEPRHNLSLALIQKGDYAQAEELIKKLMEENPKEPQLPTILGMAYLGQGKTDAAMEQHKQALALDPTLYEAKLNMAITYETIGDTERALFEYERLKSVAPDDPYLYLSLGDLYYAKGDREKVLENWNKSKELSPHTGFTSAVQAKIDELEAEKGVSVEVLSQRLSYALVQVQATRFIPDPMLPLTRTIPQTSTGAGFIINTRGEIITSAALVSGAQEIAVRVYQPEAGGLAQTPYKAEIVANTRVPSVKDVPFLDFALLRMTSPPSGLKPLEMGSTSKVEAGATVYTMGYPGGNAHRLIEGSLTEIQSLPGDEKQRLALLNSYPAMKASPVKKVKLLMTGLNIDEQMRGAPLVSKLGHVIGINVVDLPGYKGQSISLDIDSARYALQR